MNDLTKQILALSEETLGKGYFSRETLAEKMERTVNGPVTLVLDGKLVGFAMAYPPGKWSQGPNLSFPSDGMGFLETVLVEPISRNL